MVDIKSSENLEIIGKDLLHFRLLSFLQSLAGFVHNVSNPLTIISTKAQLLKMKMPQNNDYSKIVDQCKTIESMLNNIILVSQNILDKEIDFFDVNTMLKNEFEYFNTDAFFKHNIKKEFEWSSELSRIKFSYFDVSTLLFFIMQILLPRLQNSPEKLIKIKTDGTDTTVFVDITASCKLFSDPIIKAIVTSEPPLIEDLDEPEQNLSNALKIAKTSGITLDIKSEQERCTFLISIPSTEQSI